MGACASRFKIMKEAGDAPATRELKLDAPEEAKDEVVAEDNEAKHQSLGHLFEQYEKEKGSAEQPRLENEPEPKSQGIENLTKDELEKVAESDALKAGTSEEETKAEDVKLKPEIQTMEANASPRKEDEKKAAEIESSVKAIEVSDRQKDVKGSDENKPSEKHKSTENSPLVEKAVEAGKKVEDKPAGAEKPLAVKKVGTEKVEVEKVVLDEKPIADTKNLKGSPEVKDKQVLETAEVEKPVASNQPVATNEKAEAQEEKKLSSSGGKSS